jgi:hypothetical protein
MPKEAFNKWREFLSEQTAQNFDSAIETIKSLGYDYSADKSRIKVLHDDREEALGKVSDALEPMGYTHNTSPSYGTMGRLELKDRSGGNVYIYFKPKTRSTSPARSGMDYEEQLAEKFRNLGLDAKSAGTGHGSDLIISGASGTLKIEAKTGLAADFGQFTIKYDPRANIWQTKKTKSFVEKAAIYQPIFDSILKDYLNENCMLPVGDPRLSVSKTGDIVALKQSPKTGELKRELQSQWFNGRTDLWIPFDFVNISKYYASKGDEYIQIKKSGLYALTSAATAKLAVPLFSDAGLLAYVRFRLKPSMGQNSRTSFTVAVKVRGRLDRSPLDLDDDTTALEIKNNLS